MNLRAPAALIVALLMSACSYSTGAATVSQHSGGASCSVWTQAPPGPDWAVSKGGPPDVAWIRPTDGPPGIVGFVFNRYGYLTVGSKPHADGSSNKVLWMSSYPGRLTIASNLLGMVGPEQLLGTSTDTQWPSLIDLPRSGCWQLTLSWGSHRAVVPALVK
jgi:hypothetical protein